MTLARCRFFRGFTLIEMVVVVLIVSVLASAAMPLAALHRQRTREHELRESLRTLRIAIDAYKKAWDEGRIARNDGDSGYPPSLAVLVEGVAAVEGAGRPMAPSPAVSPLSVAPQGEALQPGGLPGAMQGGLGALPQNASVRSGKLYFLRRLPRDPFAAPELPAEQTWALRSYASPPEAPEPGADVFDVHSKAEGAGLDGTLYRQW